MLLLYVCQFCISVSHTSAIFKPPRPKPSLPPCRVTALARTTAVNTTPRPTVLQQDFLYLATFDQRILTYLNRTLGNYDIPQLGMTPSLLARPRRVREHLKLFRCRLNVQPRPALRNEATPAGTKPLAKLKGGNNLHLGNLKAFNVHFGSAVILRSRAAIDGA